MSASTDSTLALTHKEKVVPVDLSIDNEAANGDACAH